MILLSLCACEGVILGRPRLCLLLLRSDFRRVLLVIVAPASFLRLNRAPSVHNAKGLGTHIDCLGERIGSYHKLLGALRPVD